MKIEIMNSEEFNKLSASSILICTSSGGTDDICCLTLQEMKEETKESENYSMINRMFEENSYMHGNNTEIISFADNKFIKILFL
jgi:hypothetical protein